jgi:nitroreductase
MEFSDLVRARRAVRRFDPKPVEDDKIAYILECARLAPSWANTQCWRFVVVRDREVLDRLKSAWVVFNRWMASAPAVIVACADTSESGRHHGVDYWAVDAAIATEHLMLAAVDVGLGSCWIGVFDEDIVRDVLAIPPHVKVITAAPLGYPASGKGLAGRLINLAAQGDRRKPLEEIAHFDRW